MKRFTVAVIGILLSLGVVATPASAAVLVADADNTAFFFNFENLFDSTGTLKSPLAAPAVGDYLVGILNVQNVNANSNTHFFQGPAGQLTGIFAQEISAIGADGFGPHFTFKNPTLSTFCEPGAVNCFSTGLAAGEMFGFYLQEPATTLFNSNGPTMASDVADVVDGTAYFTLGLVSGTNYAYSHPGQGIAFGGLDFVANNTGFTFGYLVDPNEVFNGDGITGPSQMVFTSEFETNPPFSTGGSPWAFASNDPATLHPLGVIPEPSSIWLLGMGLSGLGIFSRRKKSLV